MALRFSTTGQALGAWPVSEQAAGLVSAAVDAQGDLWITTNVDVREFSPDGRRLGLWSTQGFNPGQLANPLGIVIARNGDVIVGDGSGHRVQVFSRRMTPIRQWNGPGIGVQSFEPALIAVDAQDDVYVLDTGSWQIDKYTLGGTLLGTWRSGLPKPAPGSSWNADLSVDGDGNVYAMVSVGSTLAIEKLSPSGRELRRWTSVGRHGAVSSGVDGLRFAGKVGYLSLADGRVLKVDERMHVLADWTLQRLQRPLLRSPLGIAAGSAGRVYVADDAAHEVIGLSFRTGSVTRWKAAMAAPAGPFVPSIAVDPSGDVVVADADGSRIDTYLPDGKLLRRSGTSAGPSNPIRGYTGLGIDAKGYLSALTYPQSTLRTFSPSGRLNHQWCAVCDFPNFGGYATMMTVDPAGNVYIALTTMVLELSPSSGTPIHSWNAHEIAGYGTTIDVAGIAVDRQGDLYVSDLDNNALEVFSPSGNLLASWKGFGSNAAGASDLGPVTVDPQGDIFVIVGKSV
jgi:sugar lactone lactonase YvrE